MNDSFEYSREQRKNAGSSLVDSSLIIFCDFHVLHWSVTLNSYHYILSGFFSWRPQQTVACPRSDQSPAHFPPWFLAIQWNCGGRRTNQKMRPAQLWHISCYVVSNRDWNVARRIILPFFYFRCLQMDELQPKIERCITQHVTSYEINSLHFYFNYLQSVWSQPLKLWDTLDSTWTVMEAITSKVSKRKYAEFWSL
jgi:hypothetical protein